MPISTPKDANRVPAMLGTLNSDGVTVVPLAINPTNHRLKYSDGATGSSFPSVNSQRDANRIPALWGVSSADGVTPIPVYFDSTGAILIKST